MLIIEEIETEIPVYDITVEGNHNFYANDILVHNCTEIALPTIPVDCEDTSRGEIALCTLGAINVGRVGDIDSPRVQAEIARLCEIAVRAKDALLSYQDYPMPESERSVNRFRPLGFGVIGFAHWLARNNLRWGTEECLERVNKLQELIAHSLISASCKLAEEFGPCETTRYHSGWLPWDDSPVKMTKHLDWEPLRERLRTYGIRNATLMAQMPSETSSILSNETNGIEPPKNLVTAKSSADGVLPQLVPEYAKLKDQYQTLWSVRCEDYIRTIAVLQQYTDQAISANTSYDPATCPVDPETGKLPLSHLAKDVVLAYKLGLKTLYYCIVNDERRIVDDDCSSGACKI